LEDPLPGEPDTFDLLASTSLSAFGFSFSALSFAPKELSSVWSFCFLSSPLSSQ